MPAVAPQGQAREDWKILRALSECVRAPPVRYPRRRARALASIAPHFAKTDEVEPALWLNGATYAHVGAKAKVDDAASLVERRQLLHDGCDFARVRDDGQVYQGEGGAVSDGSRSAARLRVVYDKQSLVTRIFH